MIRLLTSVLATLGFVVALVSPAGASTSPRIVANPRSVMVNSATKLTGSNFPASTRITIKECSSTSWYVLANPCVSAIKVKTNASGGFKTSMTIHGCPGSSGTGTSETCYVGEPTPYGVDTMTLTGAAKITVTVP